MTTSPGRERRRQGLVPLRRRVQSRRISIPLLVVMVTSSTPPLAPVPRVRLVLTGTRLGIKMVVLTTIPRRETPPIPMGSAWPS